MQTHSTYSVKIKEYRYVFKDTISLFRKAVDFFIDVCLEEWESVVAISSSNDKAMFIEKLCHKTKKRPVVKYDFDTDFYKFPSYLRRAAIKEAVGKVSSYKSNLANNQPNAGRPKAGYAYPCMYRDDTFVRTGTYTAEVKVFIRGTWDWLSIKLKKSDVDYIDCHCKDFKECAPILQKRGKQWFLDFCFKKKVTLNNTPLKERTILAVDLGINNAYACCVMRSDGTVVGRKIFSLPKEKDSLNHKIGKIKKAQQHGNRKTPRLWAKAKGVNKDIATKTASSIIDMAVAYNVDVIVFEHLDLNHKKRGSKKQRLHLWRANYVQEIVTGKAHRLGMRISHVNAWRTSKLAFDDSGPVSRGEYLQNGKTCYNYSICVFSTGKTYNCDLNASYNIGARYFIRELLKSLSATARLDMETKVSSCAKRSTCTLSDLINLNAALVA